MSPVGPQRWKVIKDILADARDRPRTGRRSWLETVCGGDDELLREVEGFLAHEEELQGFIEEPILPMNIAGSEEEPSCQEKSHPQTGRKVGPYRLVRLLAKGGMGAVYLAQREEHFEQSVALKLLRRGLSGPAALELFHSERQILARLEHPNIARILDGGTTDDGAPYFAMELIEGAPIDRYCEQHELTTRQRLELFLPVLSALELAHQNLVIHSDLKPGNILVDASGNPKLLDFGIARLLQPWREGDGRSEVPGHQAMTPRYASPEQLGGQAISTASDIYSSGVVLYQVLTGYLPASPEGRTTRPEPRNPVASRSERNTVRNEPVEELSHGKEGREARAEADSPQKQLNGDIEAILSKALQPEARQRYPSAERLAADIRRHLDDLPVLAREGTAAYRASKFVRRHRWGLASLAAIVALVIAFTAALAHQLYETEQSRDQAQEISTFLIELFQSAAPDRAAGKEPTMRELLDLGRTQLETAFEDEPEVRAILLLKLGEIYSKLGDYREARELLAASIGLLRSLPRENHPDLATALADLAAVHFQIGDLEKAEALFRESLSLRRKLDRPRDLIKPMNNLATILMAREEFSEAEVIYRESLGLRRALLAESPADTHARKNLATNLRSLAEALSSSGDLEGAEPLLRESLELRRSIYGPESPMVATVLLSLGRLEQARGRLDEAEVLLRSALGTRARELGDDHLHTALARRDLAALELERGKGAAARQLLVRALRTLLEQRPADDPQTAEIESLLGAALAMEGRIAEAEGYLQRAYETLERERGAKAAKTRDARQRLTDFRARDPTVGAPESPRVGAPISP